MFRITIRDLLWLTVVVALGVAWCVDRSSLTKEIDRLMPKDYAMFGWLSEAELITKEMDEESQPNPSALAPNPSSD